MNAITEATRLIDAPCVIEGQPIEQYHGGPGISKTGLDRINVSPANFYDLTMNPARPPEPERKGQLEGQLAHCAILEPEKFATRYAVGPDVIRSTKEWKAFEAALPAGVIGIKPDQRETAMRQAEAVRRLPDVAEALAAGVAESSAYWIDQETGVLCRCRPDWCHPAGESGVILLDVKTFSDASPHEFSRQIARKRYHVQDAFYTDGYAAASGTTVLAFIFVAVQDAWPFAASAVMLDPRSQDQGRRDYRRNLVTYADCLTSGNWPGFGQGIHLASLPNWAFNDE
ncbi:PD-(D/E)XK nuclease-like domain-containing protein [Bordetella avium]|uniref:PD-(D/E)XK nuclease-like domain-containing protein n=3 Tax=Bordetella avium TaxID=521 RepID=UPI000E14323C|nr:PD-(D/E)XK nuclease-like domain-containing protein [Bordetella avium]RIQ11918.1 exonuclease VIII [Bordetella avium]RIQ43709.1 exonuclease VIII [Bordetella avium]RIQ48461.1 exonuclease VIII [Bordetella avium]RIQ57793.1 exonuclease VIII [Bordetella avium]RIQ58445.1 exonuclease VIII [Bordetella avium]